MVKFLLKIALSLFVLFNCFLAQETKEIKEKKVKLGELKKEISKLEEDLKNKALIEKKSLDALENLKKQELLLNRVVHQLSKEEKQVEQRIKKIETDAEKIQKQIDKVKSEYSDYIVWMYKYGKKKKLDFLLNAESVEQSVLRYKYFEEITDKNERKIDKLQENVAKLNLINEKLKSEKEFKHRLTSEKLSEQKQLRLKKNEKSNLLEVLEKDQVNIEKEIERKKLNEIEIKNMISKLIEDEMERLRKLRMQRLEDETVKIPERYNYSGLEKFNILRGKLDWPVRFPKVHRKFGENKHAKLNTVTQNYGIDIIAEKDVTVRSVAEGYVSTISWLPGYGSIIIITHNGDYRTVYGHISDIEIEEGQKVNKGTILGKVTKSLEGRLLHFEIWNEKNFQNPERWLAVLNN